MSAPARKPYYWDHGTTEEGEDPAVAMGWLIDHFIWSVPYFPDWLVEDKGIEVALRVAEHRPGVLGIIGFTSGGIEGTVQLRPDPSGWVLVTGHVAEAEVFRAYLERPWEQWEFWPPGATPERGEEGPGRIGKHMNWIGANSETWPGLAPIANELGGVHLIVDEEKLRVRMRAEEIAKAAGKDQNSPGQ